MGCFGQRKNQRRVWGSMPTINRVNHRANNHANDFPGTFEGYEERSLIALCPSLEVGSPAARANMEAVVFLGVPLVASAEEKQPKMRLNRREREGACWANWLRAMGGPQRSPATVPALRCSGGAVSVLWVFIGFDRDRPRSEQVLHGTQCVGVAGARCTSWM